VSDTATAASSNHASDDENHQTRIEVSGAANDPAHQQRRARANQVADPIVDSDAIVMAVSAGFWGCALPPLFALAAQIIPPSVTASGV
jgi:hypothetical protein